MITCTCRYDCDQFTRFYYKEKLNMEQPQSISVERPPPQPVKPVRLVIVVMFM